MYSQHTCNECHKYKFVKEGWRQIHYIDFFISVSGSLAIGYQISLRGAG